MNIALIGYGKMGREIEKLVTERGVHSIISVSYRDHDQGLDKMGIQSADVAIDFTSPEIVIDTINQVTKLGTPLVVGTTGWYDRIPEVKRMMSGTSNGFVYGENFSVGANMFFAITSYASSLIHQVDDYDVFGIETHHTGKKDTPSGTARRLAEIVMTNYPRKKRLQTEALQRKIESEELHFASVRGGRNFGKHEIIFDSPSDEIRLTHQAWGRQGFAEGAILAAEFISNHSGFYNFSDVFTQQFLKQEVKKK
jgi:4-hydroxy-tetrahydrodipicolinate reductase